MNSYFIKRNFLFLLILSFLLIFFIFDLDDFFTIEYFQENYQFIQEYINKNYLLSLFFYYFLFLIMISLILPVSSIMVIFSSFLFSLYTSIILSVFIITLGGVFNFLLLKKIVISRIFKKADTFLKKINMKFKNNEIQYLFLLRLIPMPYIIQNSIAVILNVSLKLFFITTLIGVTPFVVIYSLAGFQLKQIITRDGPITINELINYENFIIIGLIFFLIFASIIAKRKLQ